MMIVSDFFYTWPGRFLAQSFLHTLVAAMLVDIALLAWKIENPRVRQAFRLIVIVTPILSFPLYELFAPLRGTQAFRIDALFDMNRWLHLELWGPLTAGVLFILFLGFAAAVFLLQEIIPILRHAALESGGTFDAVKAGDEPPVALALAGLPGGGHEVLLIEDEEPLIFSTTGKKPSIYVSRGLLNRLDAAELKAAVAHELGHIRRSRRPLMALVFLLRTIMFFNPIVLMEFRRIVQEEEKICDDYAVAVTGGREALAGALSKLSLDENPQQRRRETDRLRDRIEEYSHSLLMDSRISRLEGPPPPRSSGNAILFAITALTIAGVNYFLV